MWPTTTGTKTPFVWAGQWLRSSKGKRFDTHMESHCSGRKTSIWAVSLPGRRKPWRLVGHFSFSIYQRSIIDFCRPLEDMHPPIFSPFFPESWIESKQAWIDQGLGHGGFVPEELTGALLAASYLPWNAENESEPSACAKLAVVITDAPCHGKARG